MTPDQIAQPPEIQFKVDAGRNASADVKLTKSSGNPLVDDACVSAAQQTRKVPPPPGGKRARLRRRLREVIVGPGSVLSRKPCVSR